MIMGILLLLVANILIMIGCLIKRKFKASLLLSIPVIIFILVVTWFFTPVPVSLGIVKLPVIEFVKVRNIIENDSLYVDVEHESTGFSSRNTVQSPQLVVSQPHFTL